MQQISKSQFKSQLLEYLRQVESKKQPLTITHEGKPVVQVIPYKNVQVLDSLRDSVISFQDPIEPVAQEDWEALE